jgi:hypothetical protein
MIAGGRVLTGTPTTAAVCGEVSDVADVPPEFVAVSTTSIVDPTSANPRRYVGPTMAVETHVGVQRYQVSVYVVGLPFQPPWTAVKV